jgi:hypothetical protein
MPDAGIRAAQRGIQAGVVEAVSVYLVEAEGDIQRRGTRFVVLPAQVLENLIAGHGKVADAAFEEITGQCSLGPNDQLGCFRPGGNLPEQRPEPAEILLVGPFLGPDLGYGESEHALKVRGAK